FSCAIRAKATGSAKSNTTSIPPTAASPGMKNTSPSLAQKASLTFSRDGNEKAPVVRGLFFNASEIETSCLSLRFGSGSRHGRHFFASRALDAGSLALQIAQIIQPRPANFTLTHHFNRADGRRVQRENALEADA